MGIIGEQLAPAGWKSGEAAMGDVITSVRLHDRAARHVYGVQGHSSLYLLDLRGEPRVMRIPGLGAREYPTRDRRWWKLLGVSTCDERGNTLVAGRVEVGKRARWEPNTPDSRGWTQTICESITVIADREVPAMLTVRGIAPSEPTRTARANGQPKQGPTGEPGSGLALQVCPACGREVSSSKTDRSVAGAHLARGGVACPGGGRRLVDASMVSPRSGKGVPAEGCRPGAVEAGEQPSGKAKVNRGRQGRIPYKCKGCGRQTTVDQATGVISSHTVPRSSTPRTCDYAGIRLSKEERKQAINRPAKVAKRQPTVKPIRIASEDRPVWGRHGSVLIVQGGLPSLGRQR